MEQSISPEGLNSENELLRLLGLCIYSPEASSLTEEERAALFDRFCQRFAALKISEDRLRAILQASPDDITYIDMNGVIQSVSPAGQRMFGFTTPEEPVGTNIFQYLHPDDRERALASFSHSRKGIHSGARIYRVLRNDGAEVRIDASVDLVFDSSGQPTGMVMVIQDVTQNERIKESLSSSQELLHLLTTNIRDVIWTMDLHGHFTYVSPSVERLRGYTVEEVLKQSIDEALTPASAAIAKQGLQDTIDAIINNQSVKMHSFQLEQPCKDGSTVWTEVEVGGMYDVNGRFYAILGVSRDATERLKIEKGIKEQRAFAEALNEIASVLNSSLQLEEVLDCILHTVELVVSYDAIDVMLLDETQTKVHFVRSAGYKKMNKNGETRDTNLALPLEDARNLREAIATRLPVIIDDTRQYAWAPMPATQWILSNLCAPIISREQVMGFLSLSRGTVGAYTQADAERLQAFANQTAIALENARLYEQMKELAATDALTGIKNRRHFEESTAIEFERAKRYQRPLCALMADIDNFKTINDTYGHAAGDQLLIKIAHACTDSMRKIDLCGRIGGDEFAFLLPETQVAAAFMLAERVRNNVEHTTLLVDGKDIHVSISIGIAELTNADRTPEELLARADAALYQAKKDGRNRTSILDTDTLG